MSDACSIHDRPIDYADILNRLKGLSSAEEFFTTLNVDYDPKILHVCRLHILKRMGQYLADEDFDALPDRVVAARAKATLERAYGDFVSTSPLSQRVFKVLKDHDPDKPAEKRGAFISMEEAFRPFGD